MPLTKHENFSFNHSDQPNDLYNVETSTQIKANFDSRAKEVSDVLNTMIDQLQSIADGDSGADNIGATPISTSPNNVQGILEWLHGQIVQVSLGQIPDGSITPDKLSFDPATQQELDTKQDALPPENRRKITFGTADPTGGEDGDIYFQYE